MNRREILRTGSLGALGLLASRNFTSALAQTAPPAASDKKLFSSVGIASSLGKAADLKAQGIEFLTENVGDFLAPNQPDEVFEKNLAKLAASPLPILACNGFIRAANMHCVGPDTNHDLILNWTDITCRRLKKAGGKFIVFGSSGARKVPAGWPVEKANEQFVALLKKMGPLAEAQGVTITVEQLRVEECNFINHIGEGAALIRAAGHPNIRLLADLYHMACGGDTPADLKAAMDVVVHVEIAEKKGRSIPGIAGDDFRPYFHVLRECGYKGVLNIEAKWDISQIRPALAEIAKQSSEA